MGKRKNLEEILGMLDGKEKLVLYGCGGCATGIFSTDDTNSIYFCWCERRQKRGNTKEASRVGSGGSWNN